MLIPSAEGTERVTTAHKAKLAYIYVCQSTAGQVRQHQESTELQYHLVMIGLSPWDGHGSALRSSTMTWENPEHPVPSVTDSSA